MCPLEFTFYFVFMESVTPYKGQNSDMALGDSWLFTDIYLLSVIHNTDLERLQIEIRSKISWLYNRLLRGEGWYNHRSPENLWLVWGTKSQICASLSWEWSRHLWGHMARNCPEKPQELRVVPSQQLEGKQDLSPAAARKWSLPTTSELGRGLWTQMRTTVLAYTSTMAQFSDLWRPWDNKFVVF